MIGAPKPIPLVGCFPHLGARSHRSTRVGFAMEHRAKVSAKRVAVGRVAARKGGASIAVAICFHAGASTP
eukprot:10076885-Lingulodinium_polyedra.AAC.1